MKNKTKHKTFFNWSSGKDSALSLFYLLQDKNYSVDKLFTSVNQAFERVSMHGTSLSLLKAQASAINIPLEILYLPENPSMDDYNSLLNEKIKKLKKEGFTHSAFGDIFLEDLKKYREEQLRKVGISAVFPIWKKDTTSLIHDFIDLGFKSKIICVNGKFLDKSFLGRDIDKDFLNELPLNVDPCGEKGEFHTFCYDGPIFKNPILINLGETITRFYTDPSSKENTIPFHFLDLK